MAKNAVQSYRTCGVIADFCLHNSGMYLFALAKSGFVWVYSIKEGITIGKVQVPTNCTQLSIDPSGLYIAVKTPTQQVDIYELGTGARVYQFNPSFDNIG